MHGKGILIYPNGDRYEGQWTNGLRNGKGIMSYVNGTIYEEEWENGIKRDIREVKAPVLPRTETIIFPDGMYIGELVNGKMHGKGSIIFSDGDKYVGEFKQDMIDGKGTYTRLNGDMYTGEWKDGLRNGQGIMTYANGTIYRGQWVNGIKVNNNLDIRGVQAPVLPRTETITFSDGTIYRGELVNGKMHGTGTYTYANGSRYEGKWKDGKMHGTGTYTYRNGDRYTGEWKDGKMHGTGTYTYANGDKYAGEWKDGKMHGTESFRFAPPILQAVLHLISNLDPEMKKVVEEVEQGPVYVSPEATLERLNDQQDLFLTHLFNALGDFLFKPTLHHNFNHHRYFNHHRFREVGNLYTPLLTNLATRYEDRFLNLLGNCPYLLFFLPPTFYDKEEFIVQAGLRCPISFENLPENPVYIEADKQNKASEKQVYNQDSLHRHLNTRNINPLIPNRNVQPNHIKDHLFAQAVWILKQTQNQPEDAKEMALNEFFDRFFRRA